MNSTHALCGVAACHLAGIRCIVWEHLNCKVDMALYCQKLAPKVRPVCTPDMAPALPSVQYAPDSSGRVLAIERLTHQKGFGRILAVWGKIIQGWRVPCRVLRIMGSGPQASMRL
ncbi:hypothetical protein PY793_04530 [Acetobacter fabarum]|uniref:hypothetical protein n=1 Tax=Acetobacter fabarum TaxID=483199 RepID=UPI00312B4B17